MRFELNSPLCLSHLNTQRKCVLPVVQNSADNIRDCEIMNVRSYKMVDQVKWSGLMIAHKQQCLMTFAIRLSKFGDFASWRPPHSC